MACTNNIPEQLAAKLKTTSLAIMRSWKDRFEEHAVPLCSFEIDPDFEPENLVRDWYSLCDLLKQISPELYKVDEHWLQLLVAKEEPAPHRREGSFQ